MALALLFPDDTVMFLDAVTNYTKSYSSSISSHPIDKSAVITDHVSKDNPSFSIKGVVSSADFHSMRSPEFDTGETRVSSEYNNIPNNAVIKNLSSALDYLPSSVQQFINNSPQVSVEVDPFRGYSHQLARERLEQAWQRSEKITILDYDHDFMTGRTIHVKHIENCFIQNYTDNEDAQTGDALEFTITFAKVRFAYLKEVDIEVTRSEVADSASGKSDEGEQQGDSDSDLEGRGSVTLWEDRDVYKLIKEVLSLG